MTSIYIEHIYIDKLYDIVNKYNNIYHRSIKMRPADGKKIMYIDLNKENNKEGPSSCKYHVTISKYKNIFAKTYVPN